VGIPGARRWRGEERAGRTHAGADVVGREHDGGKIGNEVDRPFVRAPERLTPGAPVLAGAAVMSSWQKEPC